MNIDITSTTNAKIKWIKSLHKNSTRRQEGVFLVEGAKEIAYAMEGGFIPHSFFVCPEIYGEVDFPSQASDLKDFYTVTKEVFEKITYRGNSDGLLGIFRVKDTPFEALNLNDNPFLIVIESIEKPGNLGAIIRTADGVGADAVIVCDPKCDIYNPNVIRASVGTVFSKQICTATSEEVFDFLEKHEIQSYGAILSKNSINYTTANYTTPTALILGTEHDGLTSFWKQRSKPIMIPMRGSNDSLNVSSAAAVLAYEVARQRSPQTT